MLTTYRGSLFHNVTQAQWAFLLDLFDIEWEYTGDRPVWLPHDDLAPTFFLPGRNTWLRADNPEDLAALRAFDHIAYGDDDDTWDGTSDNETGAEYGDEYEGLDLDDEDRPRHTDVLLVALTGIPDPTKFDDFHMYRDDSSSMLHLSDGGHDACYLWTRCPDCGYVDAEFCGWADRLRCGHGRDNHKDCRGDDARVLGGYRVARRSIRAKLATPCPKCLETIAPNDLILPNRMNDGRVHWQHAGCWFHVRKESVPAALVDQIAELTTPCLPSAPATPDRLG